MTTRTATTYGEMGLGPVAAAFKVDFRTYGLPRTMMQRIMAGRAHDARARVNGVNSRGVLPQAAHCRMHLKSMPCGGLTTATIVDLLQDPISANVAAGKAR